MAGPVPVIPSVAATIEALQASVTAIMNKVAALPVEELVASLTKTAAGLEAIVNTPDIQATAKSLGETIAFVQQTISRINAGATPLLGSVTSAAQNWPAPRCVRRRPRSPRSSAPSAPARP